MSGIAADRHQGAACEDCGADLGERFFRKCAYQGRPADRKTMINRTHRLPITRQAEALGISRCTVNALLAPISKCDQQLMKRIDRLPLEMSLAGSRMLSDLLLQEGIKVGRMDVATLMKRMNIEALYCKPRTTRKHLQHRVYPYLLRGMAIDRPNQVWAMDITYSAPSLGRHLDDAARA